MGIFGTMIGKIFHSKTAAAEEIKPPTSPVMAVAVETARVAPPKVDIDAILADMEKLNTQKLNWRTSIVDLMKLLDIDSSLKSRQELAKELKFSGDMNDSASMNIWLQKEFMRRLAENGGHLPPELMN
jgi:hypothetical protein